MVFLWYAQKKYRLLQRAIASGNLGDVRRHADEKTVKVLDHGGRNALHRAVLFERRFIVNELLKQYSKYLINGTDAVSSHALTVSLFSDQPLQCFIYAVLHPLIMTNWNHPIRVT